MGSPARRVRVSQGVPQREDGASARVSGSTLHAARAGEVLRLRSEDESNHRGHRGHKREREENESPYKRTVSVSSVSSVVKKESRSSRTGIRAVLAAAKLPKQLRVPQESHLRKLLTAAHTYSHNWSRITSISGERPAVNEWQRRSWPCPSRRGCISRVTVGRPWEATRVADWDAGLSMGGC